MHINLTVSVGAKRGRWGNIENEASKDFSIDLPEGIDLMKIDFSAMITSVIQAAIEEHKGLVANSVKEE